VPYLLNLVYLLLLAFSLPWFAWQAVRKGKYREGFAAKLLGIVPRRDEAGAEGGKKCIWLHAVSVGEVNLLAPLLKRIEAERPDWQCVISTTTMTGMALAKKKYARHSPFYCPFDFSWAVKTALRRMRPDVLVLAELELWPNLVRSAKKRGAKVAVVNGRLGEKSFRRYRRIRPLVAGLLRRIDLLAVQDETCAERFRQLGARPETVYVTGSMKYDGAQTDRANSATTQLTSLAGFSPDDVVLLAGSTQEPEEEMALTTFCELSRKWPQLRLVLVPRHPDRFEPVARLLDSSGLAWRRRTKLGSGEWSVESGEQGQAEKAAAPSTLRSPLSTVRVLLVDVVGELGAWWGTAQIAFVGGSLGSRGGQNMIEPAAYGAAVSFGPNTWNFRDIVAAMLDQGSAVVVRSPAEFTRFVNRCLDEPEYASELGRRAQSLVLSQLGATDRTFALLSATLPKPTADRPPRGSSRPGWQFNGRSSIIPGRSKSTPNEGTIP